VLRVVLEEGEKNENQSQYINDSTRTERIKQLEEALLEPEVRNTLASLSLFPGYFF
jgi:hypothetical protein